MGKRPQLSLRERGKIDAYVELNLSKRDMARRLRRSCHCITTYLNNKEQYGKKFKGKPPALNPRDKRRVLRAASNSSKSSNVLKRELHLNASRWTIARTLKSNNMSWCKMRKMPLLTQNHKDSRLQFCRKYMQQTWEYVWFTDEKRFCLDGPDCTSYYWHDLRKDFVIRGRRQGGGGGVMVWGGISSQRKTDICFVENTMNAERYQAVLANTLLHLFRNGDLLVQDNAPPHACNSTRAWLNNNGIPIVTWPSRSPDLNPIENVWGVLVRAVYAEGKQYTSIIELRNSIQKEWRKIELDLLKTLITSMPQRIFDCITAKGSHTRY